MKKIISVLISMMLVLVIALPCMADGEDVDYSNVEPLDASVFEPLSDVDPGTYHGHNDYGETTLEVDASGSFVYDFTNQVFGDIIWLQATGSVVDGEFATDKILNPTMGNFDATDQYNLTEFGYQIKSTYLGIPFTTEAMQAAKFGGNTDELAEKVEASRIPTLIVTLIILAIVIAVTIVVMLTKYKKRWKKYDEARAKGVEAVPEPEKESREEFVKHQVVMASLYGDSIPVTFAENEDGSRFYIIYEAMGNFLEGTGDIKDGEFILDENCVGFINNMLEIVKPQLKDDWKCGKGA